MGAGGPGRQPHPTLQIRLTQQRLPAEVEVVPTPGIFASQVRRRDDQVLVGRQEQLPIRMADPGAVAQAGKLKLHRSPRRPRLEEAILQAQHARRRLGIGGQRHDEHPLAPRTGGDGRIVEEDGGLVAIGPFRQGDREFAPPRGELQHGKLLARSTGRPRQAGLDPCPINCDGRFVAGFAAKSEGDFRRPLPSDEFARSRRRRWTQLHSQSSSKGLGQLQPVARRRAATVDIVAGKPASSGMTNGTWMLPSLAAVGAASA